VRARLAQREAALALVALLAGVLALTVTISTRSSSQKLPAPVGSYAALAGASEASAFAKHTICGVIVGPATEGVAHPVLPCGVRIYLTYRGRTALTQVIAHAPILPGAQFAVTGALARRLGLVGVRRINWSYAQAR